MSFDTSDNELSEGTYRMFEEREKKKEENKQNVLKEARSTVDVLMPEMQKGDKKELKVIKSTIPKQQTDLDIKRLANEMLKNESSGVCISFPEEKKGFIRSRDGKTLYEIPDGFEDIPIDSLLDMLEDTVFDDMVGMDDDMNGMDEMDGEMERYEDGRNECRMMMNKLLFSFFSKFFFSTKNKWTHATVDAERLQILL